uniref:Uracil-DNA glycosylase-like domain-containing protein n=1 Tax=viral metagenome TaxID=1070528 RepID=A0A6C0ELU8_9ZZZZ
MTESGYAPSKLEFIENEKWSWKDMDLWAFLAEGNYPRSWKSFFIEHSQDLYLISEQIKKEANGATIYPPINQVFRAFIPLEKIKVVILGQDPYHNGSAVGLCFSVKPGNDINPSLRSIYTELKKEGYTPKENGDLTHWNEQGCVMLNTALTVEKGCPEVHLAFWYEFIKEVIKYINLHCRNVAWLLMGAKALAFKPYVDSSHHQTFITSHPMPLSAYKGFRGYDAFIGSNVFRNINSFLKDKEKKPIEW